ncbi:MAG: hypothetical protein PWR20_1302 [Bacteroidales bacterium]|jgi:hypothetical protein|nr:hypothetical protein [Bacteroidales bacterium]MDN5330382.1 hypothetical protein [Bacteroidales bacterium]
MKYKIGYLQPYHNGLQGKKISRHYSVQIIPLLKLILTKDKSLSIEIGKKNFNNFQVFLLIK